VVLYRLLTGRLPFEKAAVVALLYQVVHVEPTVPRRWNPAIPQDLETICLKALEKHPNDRFPSAAALAKELGRWLRGKPLRIRPATRGDRAWRWANRHPRVTGLAAVAAVLFAVLGWLAWAARLGEVAAKQRAVEAEIRQDVEARARAEVQVHAILDAARRRQETPTQGRRWEAQALLRKIAEPRKLLFDGDVRDGLDLEARSLFAATLGVPDVILDVAAAPLPIVYFLVWRVAVHPGGRSLVIGTHRGPVRWERGRPPRLPEGLDPKQPRPRLAYSPDGTYLAFLPAGGGLVLYDEAVTHPLINLEPGGTSAYLAVGFDREAKTLWACRGDGAVRSWPLPHFQPGPAWHLPCTPSYKAPAPAGASER
jgi:hypothetical protein